MLVDTTQYTFIEFTRIARFTQILADHTISIYRNFERYTDDTDQNVKKNSIGKGMWFTRVARFTQILVEYTIHID